MTDTLPGAHVFRTRGQLMLAAASVRETIDETEDPGTRLILGGILIGLGAAHQIVKTGSLDRAVAEMNEAIEDVLKEKEKK